MSGQDNMCGGANPLKSFQDQIGRDRSLHQDRAVNNGTPSTVLVGFQSFRSGLGQTTTNGDQEFANFQAGMANLPSLPAMPTHLNGPIQGHPSPFAALGPRPQPAPAPANVAAVSPNWAEEFRQLQANMVHAAPAPVPAHGLMSAPPPPHGIMSAPAPAMGFNTAARFNPMFQQQHMAMVPAQAQSTVPASAAAEEAEHPLVKDAFDAQFAQVEANQEAVDHLQRHEGSFEDEMNQWMQEQESGPPMTAEEQEAAIEQFHDERMTMIADAQDNVEHETNQARDGLENINDDDDDDVNALADDMAKTHVDDLRRTAGEIVGRLGDAPQYQQSTFLTLMRNIMEGNVTVDEAQEGFVTTNDRQPYTGHLEDAAPENKQEKK
ncbi:hypothetical protein PpBr36_08511 [Pyricularia pennisetigena]|uniref:hypothetical protein n=1 Tax=Pyricularia pennisetigena TaxID=1578925 RepID=UPI0011529C8F|nr:hypothetical protein PpBr36_08511 [Pyricularia pennisetigena]TLS24087.1 hypothetical protein PpBr36_08511 [Pyricularia pennisetigena]